MRALRSQARAIVSNRTLGKQTRNSRLIEYLGGKVISLEELKEIGLGLQNLLIKRGGILHSSVALSWFVSSQAWNSSGPEKKVAGRSGVPPGVPI